MISKLIKLGIILSVILIIQACGDESSEYGILELDIDNVSIIRDASVSDSLSVDSLKTDTLIKEPQIFIDSI